MNNGDGSSEAPAEGNRPLVTGAWTEGRVPRGHSVESPGVCFVEVKMLNLVKPDCREAMLQLKGTGPKCLYP